MIKLPLLHRVADIADEAMDLDVDEVLAMHADPLNRLSFGASDKKFLCRLNKCSIRFRDVDEQPRQVVHRVQILTADHLLGQRDTVVEFKRQHDFENEHGIEIQILVQPGLRREGIHVLVVELVAQDRPDRVEYLIVGHQAASVRTGANSPVP